MIASSFGSFFGLLAVIFGAFGAHALKKIFSVEQQQNFETGVRYQMYHALVLLLIDQLVSNSAKLYAFIVIFFVAGILLFSFSIYGLCLSSAYGKKLRFLGPVTPLGGLLLVLGWALLLFTVFTGR